MMELVIKQIKKELFSAVFEIWVDAIKKEGNIQMQGSLGSREGVFRIQYDNFQVQMS